MAAVEEKTSHFKAVQFMYEAGTKLHMKSIPLATAITIYHKFFHICHSKRYDTFTVGTTALYLASKVEEDHLKIRDVINVCHRCLHKSKAPLDLNTTYWALRDSITQCELFILRALQFQVSFTHPHKFLLHYIKSVSSWLNPDIVQRVPIPRTAWSLLRDIYQSNMCIRFRPEHIAVAIMYLTLQCHGIDVPGNKTSGSKWYEALCHDLTLEEIRLIVTEIMDMYSLEY